MDYRTDIDPSGSTATVVFSGNITFSENLSFRQMLRELEEKKPGTVTFDLSGVGMVDSAGLGMFLIAREKAENGGFKLGLTGAAGHVASMLKLTKLSDLIIG